MKLKINLIFHLRNLISNLILTFMSLEPAKGLPAYKIPPEVKKQSWSKKRKKRKKRNAKSIPQNISEIIRTYS